MFGDPETRLQLPDPGGPRVIAHSPQGVVPGPESAIRLTFDQQMDMTGFDPVADVVSFTAAGGADLAGAITGYTWQDGWTLDVYFLPQSAVGSYELVIGPDIPDAEGDVMDHDMDGEPGEPGEDSYIATFTISGGQGGLILYSADMSTDPGWTLDAGSGDARWEWGIPSGSDGDPTGGHTGAHVMGYDLSGAYPNDIAAAQYATTPAFDSSDATRVILSFQRWLGVEESAWDHATIEVSAGGGAWTRVWSNGGETIEESSWTLQQVDISPVAAGESDVRVRWGMGPTDSSVSYSGWNIDDVVVRGASDVTFLYSADMSVDPGWSLDAGETVRQWQWGVPTGNAGDPTGGYTGDNVIGYNLGGDYADFIEATQYATTPAFDGTGAAGVTLSFQRWLGVEDNEWDHATIEVSVDGVNWVVVWSNGVQSIEDTSWTFQQVDISAVADGQDAVQVRWGMGPTDTSLTYCGWNIDDVVVTDGVGAVLYSADMSTDPGWTLDSDPASFMWAWGGPAGNAGDPDAGATGDSVIGFNLNGPYPNDMSGPQYATTPAFDGSGYVAVTLTFQRWLGVESGEYDRATIEVSAGGGPWIPVWSNHGLVEDTAWTFQAVDISFVADGQGDVRVRWGMGPTDGSEIYGGWNIDDVTVTGQAHGLTVFTHSPTGEVLAGVAQVDVIFAAPVEPNSLTPDQVTVLDPAGEPVAVLGLSTVNDTTCRIDLDPQSALGEYTVLVGPGVRDSSGSAMDQDGDGTIGEDPDDVYVGTFTVVDPDTDGPAVTGHTPAAQVATAQDALQLHFDEPMDTSSFTRADITGFAGPTGALFDQLRGFQWLDSQTLEIRFAPQVGDGQYTMVVGPDILDDAPGHNPMDQNGDGLPGRAPEDMYYATFTICEVDLFADSLSADVENLQTTAGEITLDLAIVNVGGSDAGPFDVRFYLSDDPVVNTDDLPVALADGGLVWPVAGLVGGATVSDAVALLAPATDPFGTDNDYYLGMIVDDGDRIVETDERNNVRAVGVHYLTDQSGPSVDSHIPDGLLSQSVSAVTLIFDEPMNATSFSVADDVVGFTGPGGSDIAGEITGHTWLDSRVLRIEVHTLRSTGAYELVVGPGILDLSGNAMDQDRDGAAGETPEDRYAADFYLRNGSGPVVEVVSPSSSPAYLSDTSSMLLLEAVVTDDGVGGPDGLVWGWFVGIAPDGATVALDQSQPSKTTASFSHNGSYSLYVSASDGELPSFGGVFIVIGNTAGAENVGPTTYAGADRGAGGITTTLTGIVLDDGEPAGSPLACEWTQITGPAESAFRDRTSPVTTVAVPVAGVYVYRLTADDGQIKTADDVTLMMTIMGDANFDGAVGLSDLLALADHYGMTHDAKWRDGDFDGDGSVGLADLMVLADNYGGHLNQPLVPADGAESPAPAPAGTTVPLARVTPAWHDRAVPAATPPVLRPIGLPPRRPRPVRAEVARLAPPAQARVAWTSELAPDLLADLLAGALPVIMA